MKKRITLTLIALALATTASAAIHDITAAPYNATGTGTGDDTVAIQAAITAAQAESGAVYVPAGTYYVNSALVNGANKSLMIYGDGSTSQIVLTGSSQNIFDIYFAVANRTFTIRDVKLVTSSSSALAAVKIRYHSSASGTHTDPALVMDNVSVGVTGAGVWDYGVDLGYAWNSIISNCDFINKNTNPFEGSAIKISDMSVNFFSVSNNYSYWNTGVEVAAYQEGLYVDKSTLNPVTNGIRWSSGSTLLCLLSLQDSTINCTQTGNGIDFGANDGLWVSFLRNNVISVSDGYNFVGAARTTNFIDNIFDGNSVSGGVAILPQVAGTEKWPAVVHRNSFVDIANGASLWLTTGVYNSAVVDNAFNGGWYYDQGTSTYSAINY